MAMLGVANDFCTRSNDSDCAALFRALSLLLMSIMRNDTLKTEPSTLYASEGKLLAKEEIVGP